VRDPQRIVVITQLVRLLWEKFPDQRLGQLLNNIYGPGPHDLFHIEDDAWERMLRNTLAFNTTAPQTPAQVDEQSSGTGVEQ